jgi:hypothetical protein
VLFLPLPPERSAVTATIATTTTMRAPTPTMRAMGAPPLRFFGAVDVAAIDVVAMDVVAMDVVAMDVVGIAVVGDPYGDGCW